MAGLKFESFKYRKRKTTTQVEQRLSGKMKKRGMIK
jgi:hypothetical protein